MERVDILNLVQQEIAKDKFWDTIMNNHNLMYKIDRYVDKTVPSSVKTYLDTHVPGLIIQQLLTTLPAFLAQNQQVCAILSKHCDNLEDVLDQHARDVIKRIVQDPEYHIINKAYFDDVKRQAMAKVNNALQDVDHQVSIRLDKFNTVEKRLQTLEDSNFKLQCTLGLTLLSTAGYLGYKFFFKS